DPGSIRDALRESGPDNANLLLVIDQFEELWTQTTDDVCRKAFLSALLSVASAGDGSCRIVGAMRRGYFNLCGDYPALEERLKPDGRFLLGAMARQSLRDAIEKPLLLAGQTEVGARGLANAVLKDVTEQPGNLALVEMALTEAWGQRSASGGDL